MSKQILVGDKVFHRSGRYGLGTVVLRSEQGADQWVVSFPRIPYGSTYPTSQLRHPIDPYHWVMGSATALLIPLTIIMPLFGAVGLALILSGWVGTVTRERSRRQAQWLATHAAAGPETSLRSPHTPSPSPPGSRYGPGVTWSRCDP